MRAAAVLDRAIAVIVVLVAGCHVDRAARPGVEVRQPQATFRPTFREPRLPMQRLFALALLLGGCLGLSPEDQARTPHITVTQASANDPPVFSWAPQEATWVEVRHERSGRVVWRVEQWSSPHGPVYLRSPLVYGAYAHGPGWSPPPDAAEPRVTHAEPLVPAHYYTVTVHRTAIEGPVMQPTRRRAYEATVRFRASNTIPHVRMGGR